MNTEKDTLNYMDSKDDIICGYELCVTTMSPQTPLKYLKRHGEIRSSIPDDEKESPHFAWMPKLSSVFESLRKGATMSTLVGSVPYDGGDLLPYLIKLREIVEKPRDQSLSELDDAYARATLISKIESGFGYGHDENFNLIKWTKDSGHDSYYDIISHKDPLWAFEFALSEIADCGYDGLSLAQIEELYKKGYKSIAEIVEAPDSVLLSLKGIGQKRLEKIRANKNGLSATPKMAAKSDDGGTSAPI